MATEGLIGGSYLARYVLLNAVDISDYRVFPSRDIRNTPPAFQFTSASARASGPLLEQAMPASIVPGRAETFDQFLDRNGSVAFLAIQHDRLIAERYYHGYDHASVCTSFSTVKSFVSALVGIALHDRLIARLDDPVGRYLPELTAPFWAPITVRHLVSMSSGLKYDDRGFMPWDDQPRTYYALDLRQVARQARPTEPPGLRFHYNNYNLLLLGLILERVTGGTVSAYLEDNCGNRSAWSFPLRGAWTAAAAAWKKWRVV